MSQLVIPDIDADTLERLRERAIRHAQSVEVEARTILAEALQSPAAGDPWQALNAMREKLARSGKQFPDSTPLLREDRER
jgi:plasmid stability protein